MDCSVPGAPAFRKNHQVVTTVHHFARKREAAAKAALLRHRKYVEEEYDRKVLEQVAQPREHSGRLWRVPPFAQQLSVLGDCYPGVESPRQRKQQQRVINHGHVIANEDNWTSKTAQVLSATHSGPAHYEYDWQHNQVEKRNSQPVDWPALLPSWVRIYRGFFMLTFMNDLLDVCQCGRICE